MFTFHGGAQNILANATTRKAGVHSCSFEVLQVPRQGVAQGIPKYVIGHDAQECSGLAGLLRWAQIGPNCANS